MRRPRRGAGMILLRPGPVRYSFAVAAVLLGYLLRWALTAWVGPGLPAYITFYPAVMAVALLGGFGPGLVATVLAGAVVSYWILLPVGEWSISSPMDRVGLALFACMGLLLSTVAELYRRNRAKVAAYDREAALRQSQKTFSELVERSPFGTYIVDSQFRIALMNASSQERRVPQRAARAWARFC